MNYKANKKKVIVFFLILAMSFIVFVEFNQKDEIFYKGQQSKTVIVSIGHKQLTAFLADRAKLREKGLSGRESIYPYDGMLFVFEDSAKHGIWMKDMKFPIDIIWLQETRIEADKNLLIDADEKNIAVIIDIKKGVSPSTYPEIFTPELSAKYVLEASAGFAEENNLKIGDKVSFQKI